MKQEIIRLGSACNQKCLFCNQEGVFNAKQKKEILLELLSIKKKGVGRVVISGGEPSIFREELFFTISTSKKLGFKEIEIQSNAVLLSSMSYAKKLKDLGLTRSMISLHSFDDQTSDMLTQSPGTHMLTLQGIKNLISIGVDTTLNFVMNRYNYKQVLDYTEYAHKNISGFSSISFSVVVPGTLTTEFNLLPRYSEISSYLEEAYDYCIEHKIHFQNPGCGIPICFVKDYYLYSLEYQNLISNNVNDKFILDINSTNKSQGDQCRDCDFRKYCLGVWNGYSEKYGFNELIPIKL